MSHRQPPAEVRQAGAKPAGHRGQELAQGTVDEIDGAGFARPRGVIGRDDESRDFLHLGRFGRAEEDEGRRLFARRHQPCLSGCPGRARKASRQNRPPDYSARCAQEIPAAGEPVRRLQHGRPSFRQCRVSIAASGMKVRPASGRRKCRSGGSRSGPDSAMLEKTSAVRPRNRRRVTMSYVPIVPRSDRTRISPSASRSSWAVWPSSESPEAALSTFRPIPFCGS